MRGGSASARVTVSCPCVQTSDIHLGGKAVNRTLDLHSVHPARATYMLFSLTAPVSHWGAAAGTSGALLLRAASWRLMLLTSC